MARKLRIAFSVSCGFVCLLLIVLWVRSYWYRDMVNGRLTHDFGFHVNSLQGRLSLFWANNASSLGGRGVDWVYKAHPVDRWLQIVASDGSSLGEMPPLGFTFIVLPQLGWKASLPHGYLAVGTGILALALIHRQRYRFNFSLRTLLIATTLVAVALGFIVWSAR